MSYAPPADSVGDDAYGQLREELLQLTQDTDERILDHSYTLTETLQFIVGRIRHILNAWHVDILFEYPDGLRIEISSDETEIGRFVPIESSISGLVLSTHEPVLVNNLQSDPELRDRYFPRVEMDPAAQPPTVLVAELTLDGRAIGVINVEASPDNSYDRSHLDFVNAMARQISIAITHAALFDEDNFRTATDRLLIEVSGGDTDLAMRQVLDHILIALNSLTFVKPDAADVLFADPQDGQRLVVAYSTNSADIGLRVDIDSSVCGEAFLRGKTVLLQRASFERPYYRPVVQGMQCEMAIPIVFGGSDRVPIGVLNLESSRENAFSVVGQVLAERFVRRVVNAIAMTKIRSDFDSELQDQLMVLAADQVLNAMHRLNNDVGSIRAVARDLLTDLQSPNPPDASDLERRLRMIGTDADRAMEIPDELRRRIVAPRASADVNAQVEAGIAAVRIPRHIQLVTDLAGGLPAIPCTALDLVVENLLLNAVKAMRNRAGTLSVRTWLDRRMPREPFISITVEDTGIGMTEEELSRLFEPRQAGHRGGGLGFGMMWVRAWVRRAHGLIDVRSERGAGTTVEIRFQIHSRQIDEMPQGGEPT